MLICQCSIINHCRCASFTCEHPFAKKQISLIKITCVPEIWHNKQKLYGTRKIFLLKCRAILDQHTPARRRKAIQARHRKAIQERRRKAIQERRRKAILARRRKAIRVRRPKAILARRPKAIQARRRKAILGWIHRYTVSSTVTVDEVTKVGYYFF